MPDYTGIKIYHAIFAETLIHPDGNIDCDASADLFYKQLITAMQEGFPGMEFSLPVIPGTRGQAMVNIGGCDSKKKTDLIYSYYCRIYKSVHSTMDWVRKFDGSPLTEEERKVFVQTDDM